MTTASGGQQTLGKILFYRQLEPLSVEKHRQLGVSNVSNPFSFLAETHLVPLTVDEFGLAAVCYPIIFDTQTKTPLAVMGLRPGMNVFLGPDGSLDPEVYLPAFARRYPFLPIIATAGAQPQKDEEQKVLVCIDRAAKMLSSTPEMPFFNGDKPSQYTQDAIQFCREFDMLGRRTQEFVGLMDKHGLFELTPLALPRAKADGTPDEPLKMGEYLRISEQKLNALPKETYLELRDRGISAVMHAHLLSLGLWPKILSRAARIQAATPLS
ncbi:MAG: SapC family protein [Hyphomonadaceae bacterium]|nr:SapC family protein [Hyphomonadaceae bacterium]